MSHPKYPHLFEPLQVGDAFFRNRIFASPTGQLDMTNGLPNESSSLHFARKAMGGAASVCCGEYNVDSQYGVRGLRHILLDQPRAYFELSRQADYVTRHGCVLSAELQHSGMMANSDPLRRHLPAYGPSAIQIGDRFVEEMPEEIILGIIDKFADAAAVVKRSGFGMVTIHAGHGWLVHQFFSPDTNKRHDRWGGSVENRARLGVAICDAIHARCGRGFPVEMRISGDECTPTGYGILDGGVEFAKQLDGHADIIHISTGALRAKNVFPKTHPSMFMEDGVNVHYAAEVKKRVSAPVATVGALGDPGMMEEIIATGKADIVEMARSLFCDPDLPNKAREGREDEIRRCMRCFTCFVNLHNTGHFYCALNPETSRDSETRWALPPAKKQRVLIAGGGIGGMQAAITASECGHEVILCEKTGRLGGHILCEENVPFKKHLFEYIALQERTIRKKAIDLRLNTEVTPELARELKPDAIIAAVGGHTVVPRIKGIDGPNVLSAEDAYTAPEKVGARAVILGAGLVGCELAIYLDRLGRKVDTVEMGPAINDGGNDLHVKGIQLEIDDRGLGFFFNTKAAEITPEGVYCDSPEGRRFFEADTVIYATGQAPLRAEALALKDCAPAFHMIGDCHTPKNIYFATSWAWTIARDLGRF